MEKIKLTKQEYLDMETLISRFNYYMSQGQTEYAMIYFDEALRVIKKKYNIKSKFIFKLADLINDYRDVIKKLKKNSLKIEDKEVTSDEEVEPIEELEEGNKDE